MPDALWYYLKEPNFQTILSEPAFANGSGKYSLKISAQFS